MYLTNKDLEILKRIKSYLSKYKILENYTDLCALIDKLETYKNKKNIINTRNITEKRKIDKNYAKRKQK